MRQATPAELAEQEQRAKGIMEAWVIAFTAYPNRTNFEGLCERMVEYQSAWMNGRARPET